MTEQTKGLTRRKFLQLVGAAGGSAAVYETMTALGLINVPAAWAGPPQIPANSGAGKSVVIIGAGIGGLTAAYMLKNAGYSCQILEAQNRAGGRSLTARHGTVITEESAAHGVTHQECKFDEGLYLNMGPGRLPYHHRRILHYCEILKVPLEIYVMSTTANLFQTPLAFDGKPQVRRAIEYDTQGYIAEMLAKAVRQSSLDEQLNEIDRERLLSLLSVFGDLNDDYTYSGSTRTGCKLPLTVYTACEAEMPLSFQYLLNSEFWMHKFYQPTDFEWQPTLFQPIGGMDQIVHGFERVIGDLIQRESVVQAIKIVSDGVEVQYRDAQGATKSTKADYCVSNIPLPILNDIPANFTDDFKSAVHQAKFADTCKVGWQANKRFWESNEYQIYGGISYIDDIITQMWYPSNDYFAEKGTLTGAYNYDAQAKKLGDMELEQRLVEARIGAIKLHREFASDGIVPQSLGLSIAWQNVPYQHGGWADWKADNTDDKKAYARLLQPDPLRKGRFFVVGDQVSTLPGWQEGAIMSAEHVVQQISGVGLLKAAPPPVVRLPNTRRLVQGR